MLHDDIVKKKLEMMERPQRNEGDYTIAVSHDQSAAHEKLTCEPGLGRGIPAVRSEDNPEGTMRDEREPREPQAPQRIGAVFVAGISSSSLEGGQTPIEEDDDNDDECIPGAGYAVIDGEGGGGDEENNQPQDAVAYVVESNVTQSCEEAVPLAKNLSVTNVFGSHRWLKFAVITAVFVIVCSIILSLILTSSNKSSSDPDSQKKQEDIAKRNELNRLYEEAAKDTSGAASLSDKDSPQSKALEWLQTVDQTAIPFGDKPRFIQRYVVTLLYFATGGPNSWIDQIGFLDTDKHECDWKNPAFRQPTLLCNFAFNTKVTHLDLSDLNLAGTIPPELSYLERLEELNLSKNKHVTGTIPSQFKNFTKLQKLYLNDMDLSGSIPVELGMLTLEQDTTRSKKLQVRLYGNDRLQENYEPLCNISALNVLEVNCNNESTRETCSCCTKCCYSPDNIC